jgi:photosystem II stability/assembly factor-like uncharacterized protein
MRFHQRDNSPKIVPVVQLSLATAGDAPLKAALVALLAFVGFTDDKPAEAPKPAGLRSEILQGLKPRLIGPAVSSGRVVAFAVHPNNRNHYYVGVASGGVWKTVNAGTTWTPIFDDQGSYSIGTVVLDPKNPSTVWVGTGENNSQRSVGYGDGVYRSDDGGKTWKHLGLKRSEHIGKIALDPRNSQVVYVAAQGPLWGPGGDRGLYKSSDGGQTWEKLLNISENTGVTDFILDPRNPDTIIAAAYQRRRHVWTLINGGPESALHKSTDGGKTWRKLKQGLPNVELGRIGLAYAPTNPDIIYATIEAADKQGGIFRSLDRGETWEKRNDFDQQAQYYGQIDVDPVNPERIYVQNVLIQISDDGGKTLRPLGEKYKHVDSHVIWIDPKDPSFYRVGCDGGIYESFDRAANWRMIDNLPVTQFYDVTCDHQVPFYHVYGGTQDNNTLGGPARTRSVHGIANADWFVTLGGDGFQSRVDPTDPNIVYSTLQYGVNVRYDRRTGEAHGIQPQAAPGAPPLRWNWDSPLIISPHQPKRLYFAANILFRSDDRGNSWTAVSPDLTRQLDRNQLPVFGKIQKADAVAKSLSTSFYGNITALCESPLKEGHLYVGTDDGLIQISKDGGKNWVKIDKFPGVPERTYVSRLVASQHDANVVYATFSNHKMADFKPYVLRSGDGGSTWTGIAANLPENGPTWAFAEDHVDPNLLFVGTEFGLFFTTDQGKLWVRIKSGLPTIAVRDLAIQPKMNDLVIGTFGRGIYILDDYSPLRKLTNERLNESAILFPVADAWQYVPTRQYGLPGKAFLGEGFYTAANPPFGAIFTYYLKDKPKTRKERRKEAEAAADKRKEPPPYPAFDELRAEADEEAAAMVFTITDEMGTEVRRLVTRADAGIHRVAWDLRGPAPTLPRSAPTSDLEELFAPPPSGFFVPPGKYRVMAAFREAGQLKPLGEPREFVVRPLPDATTPLADRQELDAFLAKVQNLLRAVAATREVSGQITTRLDQVKKAADETPGTPPAVAAKVRELLARHRQLLRQFRGDEVLQGRNENTPPSITDRVSYITSTQRNSLAKPTATQQEAYRIASQQLAEVVAGWRRMIQEDLKALESQLDAHGAPWTFGRLPDWKDK